MRFTDEALEKIEKTYAEVQKETGKSQFYMGLRVDNNLSRPGVYTNNWGICDLEDIDHMIEELQLMKEAVKRATGVEF